MLGRLHRPAPRDEGRKGYADARVDIFAIGDMIGIKNLDKILHYISVREARLSPAARMYLGL